MTLHAAKGLEFDTVIITGLEEGLLPSNKSILEYQENNNLNAIEEERRLFYVGITRAKEKLYLTNSKYRYTYGQTIDSKESRFVTEIPEILYQEYINETRASNYSSEDSNISYNSYKKYNNFKTKILNSINSFTSKFKKFEPVKNTSFGNVIIYDVHKRDSSHTTITVKFKSGLKKIDAKFLELI